MCPEILDAGPVLSSKQQSVEHIDVRLAHWCRDSTTCCCVLLTRPATAGCILYLKNKYSRNADADSAPVVTLWARAQPLRFRRHTQFSHAAVVHRRGTLLPRSGCIVLAAAVGGGPSLARVLHRALASQRPCLLL